MSRKLHLLYIPGLGDNNPTLQRLAVTSWRLWGVRTELLRMGWGNQEPWEVKFQRLLNRVDELTAAGKQVGLVAASAGASAAILVYAARPDSIIGCVLIAGKVNRPEAIRDVYQRTSPAFVTAASRCPAVLATLGPVERRRIQSRYAAIDMVVHTADSHIPGAHNRRLLSIGHPTTIASQLVFGAPFFVHFLKKLAR